MLKQQSAAKNHTSPWKPVTKDELMAMNIAMGIVSLPKLDQYWSTDPILSHPWFRTVMSRDQFREILRYIHVVVNMQSPSHSDPNYDKLWKIRPLITALEKNCRELYSPHPQLSVDESMIGKKCLSFIQYMPAKPVKWGVKVWVLCDSINGYICTFDVYTRKDTSGSTVHAHGLAYSIVMKLVQSYLKKGHIVYTDNYYSSPQLFEDLWKEGTYASGTVRTNRKHFPDFFKPQPGDKLGQKCLPTTTAPLLSGGVTTKMCMHCQHFSSMLPLKSRGEVVVLQSAFPGIIHDYNLFMGGVDLADQAMCYYSVGRNRMKWWRHVFWCMHDHAIINAHVIYKANTATSLSKPIPNLKFRLLLTQQLVEPYLSQRRGVGRTPTREEHLMGKHFPYNSAERRRCKVCAYKKVSQRSKKCKDTKTKIWCPKCEVHLCMGRCFELYHTYYRNY